MRPLLSTITAHTDETGATFLEYGLLITLVGLVAAGALLIPSRRRRSLRRRRSPGLADAMTPAARTSERGAALEFALVPSHPHHAEPRHRQPGRGYHAKVELTGAGPARAPAPGPGKTTGEAQTGTINAAPGLFLTAGDIATTPCPPGGADGNATVTATYGVLYNIPLVSRGNLRHLGLRSHAMRSLMRLVSDERASAVVVAIVVVLLFGFTALAFRHRRAGPGEA